jgi:hypothetical protein
MKRFIGFIFILSSLNVFSQNKMRPVDELINQKEPGWILVKEWIDSAKNKVQILSCDTAKAKEALYQTQVTTRSPMGAIVYSTGGLIIDYGWIRILGSGNSKLNRTLPEWNKGKTFKEYGEQSGFLLIADDAIGGFFAINAGSFGNDMGQIYYLSPDNLKWEALDLTYSDFLDFCFNGDLEEFYKGYRWNNWKDEVSRMDGNKVYSFFPYLWTKEGKDINKLTRNQIPVDEQYSFNMSMRTQLGIK